MNGVNPADVTVTRTGVNGSDVILIISDSLPGAADGGRIHLNGTWANDTTGVDLVKFGDGTVWNVTTIRSKVATSPTAGNDYITGTSAANTIDALAGDDSIFGLGGNDSLSGGDGNDTIVGGTGNDTMSGGNGDDLFQIGLGDGTDVIDGGAGTDTIVATSDDVSISLKTLANVEVITAAGYNNVSIALTTGNDVLDLTSTTLSGITSINGLAGNDTITGSAGADIIYGGDGTDVLNGGAGNDYLSGDAGNDTLSGGDGNDTFAYGGSTSGFDAVNGGNGTDTILAIQDDTVIGLTSLTGVEQISGGGFSNVSVVGSTAAENLDLSGVTLTDIVYIDGGSGDDTIVGSAGADTIFGSAGNDSLSGGNGDDVFEYTGTSTGFDAVNGGTGNDTLLALSDSTVIGLTSLQSVETISGGGYAGVYVSGSANNDTLDLSGVTLDDITKVDMGSGDDRLIGTAGSDVLKGGNGNDTLIGGTGNDTMDGGAGTDTVDYSASTSAWTINLALTSNNATSGTEVDTLMTFENVIGGSGNDTITGSSVANVISGGAGNDRIAGGAGNDTIDGGTGTDVAVFAGTQATYSITTSGGVVSIVDNAPTTDGNDGTDSLTSVEKAEFKGGVQVGLASPIVLDLDGNGVSLVNRDASSASFDWDGDGQADQTGWVGSADGLLVFDRNGDGKVSDASELSFTDDKAGAKSDLDGLSAFDSNHDGMFSAADDKFDQFRVWIDQNGNGQSDTGELQTLAQAGISSISLAGTATDQSWDWSQNVVVNTGSFTRTDGSLGALDDVALRYDPSSAELPLAQAKTAYRFAEAISAFAANDGPDEMAWHSHPNGIAPSVIAAARRAY